METGPGYGLGLAGRLANKNHFFSHKLPSWRWPFGASGRSPAANGPTLVFAARTKCRERQVSGGASFSRNVERKCTGARTAGLNTKVVFIPSLPIFKCLLDAIKPRAGGGPSVKHSGRSEGEPRRYGPCEGPGTCPRSAAGSQTPGGSRGLTRGRAAPKETRAGPERRACRWLRRTDGQHFSED